MTFSNPTKPGAGKVIGAVIVFASVIAGSVWFYENRNRISTDDAQIDGHLVSIAPKVSGTILKAPVASNQEVIAGQVLVELDPREYQISLAQARAELSVAESKAAASHLVIPLTQETTTSATSGSRAEVAAVEAEYQQAVMRYEQARSSDLGFARSNVESRKAVYDRAGADLARMKALADRQEISRSQYDEYVAAGRIAESELNAAREKLSSAQKEVEMAEAGVRQAGARLNTAKASLDRSRADELRVGVRTADARVLLNAVDEARARLKSAELELSYATVIAPVGGVVTRKSAEIGQYVDAGRQVMILVPLRDVFVVANYKETQLANVRPGQRVEIKVDMYGRKFSGRVDSIAGSTGSRLSLLPPENAAGNFVKVVQRIPVKIVFDPLPGGEIVLRPGMTVSTSILVN